MGSSSWVDWVAGVLCIGFWAGFGFYVLSCMWIFYTLLFSQERKLMLLSFQGTEVFVVVFTDLSHRDTLLLEVILTLLISRFHLQSLLVFQLRQRSGSDINEYVGRVGNFKWSGR
jgi:apolipoprotein N-acyltransferase